MLCLIVKQNPSHAFNMDGTNEAFFLLFSERNQAIISC